MAVPGFQSFMLPLLQMMQDGQEHNLRDIFEPLAAHFHLNENDKRETIPSGLKTKLEDRVSWAQTYMRKAGLLERTGRGKFRITEQGFKALQSNPPEINVKFLRSFPDFVAFEGLSKRSKKQEDEIVEESGQTPEELLEISYQTLRRNLAQEVLERVKRNSSRFFEWLVVDLLVAMGYGGSRKDAGQAVGQSGDGGIDGIIKEDKLGLDVVYIQAKRWENTVGRPIVQAFAGALMGKKANKGVLITTSQFSQDAIHYVDSIAQKIVLIDGEQLAQFMIDHGVGITEMATYTVKKIDSDYFDEE